MNKIIITIVTIIFPVIFIRFADLEERVFKILERFNNDVALYVVLFIPLLLLALKFFIEPKGRIDTNSRNLNFRIKTRR